MFSRNIFYKTNFLKYIKSSKFVTQKQKFNCFIFQYFKV
eukprot:UN13522